MTGAGEKPGPRKKILKAQYGPVEKLDKSQTTKTS